LKPTKNNNNPPSIINSRNTTPITIQQYTRNHHQPIHNQNPWPKSTTQGPRPNPHHTHYDGNQGGTSLKDHLQVLDGPITRSRAKKIKEAMQGLVQSTWDKTSKSPTIKVGLKEGEPILIHLIQAVEDMT
jgi:hypothetical protein